MVDHTGKQIKSGQKATMDSGHQHFDDWEGVIIEKENWLYFKYLENGDEVELTKYLCSQVEVKD